MIISSQGYLNFNIVNEKIKELTSEGATEITLPTIKVGEYHILIDGHHALEAARELHLKINFEDIDEEYDLDTSLISHYMDRDYYNVETSKPAEYIFYSVF